MSALNVWSVLAIVFLLLGVMVCALVMGGAVIRRRRAWRREQMDPVRSGRWPVHASRAELNRRFGR